MSDPLVLLASDGAVARITFNRPDVYNAMNLPFMRELRAAAEACAKSGARAVVLTGAGRAFSAGGDLGAFAAAPDPEAALREMADILHEAVEIFARMDAPVIAAVNGTAAGAGLSVACMCDLVVAASSAKFTMAYTNAGLCPDGSSTFFVPRLIGLRRTQELVFTNRVLSAAEALDWQLVTRVVPDAELEGEVSKLAARLAAGPTRAYGVAKRMLLASAARDLTEQLDLESRSISGLSATPDGQEGIRAFLDRRAPAFTGR